MRALIAALMMPLTASCEAPDSPSTPSPAATLEIQSGWAAPTPGGVEVSAGYLTIVNHARETDRLVGAQSQRAARVEVHEMTMADGVMQMRPVQSLDIPAGGAVALAPGGRHLMFYGVSPPFAEGETIPLRLTFAQAGAVDISLPVRRNGAEHAH
jgi:copper(I)-binding protein